MYIIIQFVIAFQIFVDVSLTTPSLRVVRVIKELRIKHCYEEYTILKFHKNQ